MGLNASTKWQSSWYEEWRAYGKWITRGRPEACGVVLPELGSCLPASMPPNLSMLVVRLSPNISMARLSGTSRPETMLLARDLKKSSLFSPMSFNLQHSKSATTCFVQILPSNNAKDIQFLKGADIFRRQGPQLSISLKVIASAAYAGLSNVCSIWEMRNNRLYLNNVWLARDGAKITLLTAVQARILIRRQASWMPCIPTLVAR